VNQAVPTRIAVLSMHTCPLGKAGTRDTGGMNIYIKEVTRFLGSLGIKVDVFTRDSGTAEKNVVSLGKNARLIYLKAGPREAVSKKDLYALTYSFAREVEGFRRLHGLEYRHIFSHYWLSGVAGSYLQQWWESGHLLMYHTLGAVKEKLETGERDSSRRVSTEASLAHSCHRVIAPTEKEKQLIAGYYRLKPSQIGVVPCGVNLKRFFPMEQENARDYLGIKDGLVALFAGRLEPEKGLEFLLQALASLSPGERPLLLVLGGSSRDNNDYRDKMRKKSRELCLENRVRFQESVDQKELRYYYNAADLCVVPSYYESFGMVALEALACGTPVVATRVGALSSLIQPGKTGYVVQVGDVEGMAAGINKVLSGRREQDPFSIRQTAGIYDWTQIAVRLKQEFRVVEQQVYGVWDKS